MQDNVSNLIHFSLAFAPEFVVVGWVCVFGTPFLIKCSELSSYVFLHVLLVHDFVLLSEFEIVINIHCTLNLSPFATAKTAKYIALTTHPPQCFCGYVTPNILSKSLPPYDLTIIFYAN